MRRAVARAWIIGGIVFSWTVGGMALAKEEPAAPNAAPQAPVVSKSPDEKKREALRAQLDGTSWALELRPEAAGKTRQDTVTFKGRTVSSEWLTKSGYGSSNYSVRVEDDGLVVWETMQSKEGEGLAFWRGEIQGAQMSGLLSKQPINGQPESFILTGRKLETSQQAAPPSAPATTEESSAGTVRAAPTPQAQPPDVEMEAPAKKKKKWGVF